VSYALEMSDEALGELLEMEMWLQEEALDEIEKVANKPELLRRRGVPAEAVFDFTRQAEEGIHYVFVTLEVDDTARMLKIMTLGHFFKQKDL
jgi:hypothetical protein